jgi:hypothetical protein
VSWLGLQPVPGGLVVGGFRLVFSGK